MVTGLQASDLEKYYHEHSLGSFMFYFDKFEWCLDATIDDGRFGRLINHSYLRPNLKPSKHVHHNKARIMFKAIADIECNSELLYNYGETCAAVIATLPWYKTT